MSRMQREIVQAMSDLKLSEGPGLSAGFLFPKEFAGFQGHFESNPVLPGICKIQAVLAMYESFYRRPFRLKEVNTAKYLSPVTSGQPIVIECHSKEEASGILSVKAAVKREQEKVALLQLTIENIQE